MNSKTLIGDVWADAMSGATYGALCDFDRQTGSVIVQGNVR